MPALSLQFMFMPILSYKTHVLLLPDVKGSTIAEASQSKHSALM
jgi:hypothetical protein